MTGIELAQIRKAAGLSQTKLGELVGINRQTVSYWENKAKVDPRARTVKRMARALQLPDTLPVKRARASWGDRLREAEAKREVAQKARFDAMFERLVQREAKRRVPCNAKTRKGTPCRMMSEPGKTRCKLHGGLSTGARTQDGIERIREAQKKRWARWRAQK